MTHESSWKTLTRGDLLLQLPSPPHGQSNVLQAPGTAAEYEKKTQTPKGRNETRAFGWFPRGSSTVQGDQDTYTAALSQEKGSSRQIGNKITRVLWSPSSPSNHTGLV